MATTNLLLKGLQASYDAIVAKNTTTLYFCTDTHAFYVGDVLYTEPVRFIAERPAVPAIGVLYLNTVSGLGETYDGMAWRTVIRAIVTEIDETADNTTTPTSKAVKDYVDGRVEGILGGNEMVVSIEQAFDVKEEPVPGTLTVTNGDDSTITVTMAGLAHNPTYDSSSMVLTIPVVGGSDLVVNLPQDNFIESGVYDSNSKAIILTLKDGSTVSVPASALADVYTSGSGTNDTIAITVSADNKISATLKVDSDGGILGVSPDGRLTADLTGYTSTSVFETKIGDIGDGSVKEYIDAVGDRVTGLETVTQWGVF